MATKSKARISTFSAAPRDLEMLEVVARYHGLNKSATIVSLIRREFWRAFPGGTDKIRPDRGAKVEGNKRDSGFSSPHSPAAMHSHRTSRSAS
jgi:hypothetical protein